MLARLIVIGAYLLYIVNIEHFIGQRANVLEKGFFLLAAATFVVTRQRNYAVLALWLLCSLMVIALGALTPYPWFSWWTMIFAMSQFAIIYWFLAAKPTPADRDMLLILVAILPLLSVLLGVVYSVAHISPLFRAEFATGSNRLAGSLISAYLSALAMDGTFAATILAATLSRPKYYVLVAVNCVIMLLAGGRSPLAAAVFASAVAFYSARSIPVLHKMVGSVIGVGVVFITMATIGRGFVRRLLESGDNGRELIWGFVRSLIAQYPWTGIGYGHQFWATPRYVFVYTKTSAAHNEFLRIESELGKIGMPLFFGMMALAVFIVWRRGNRSLLLPAGFAAFLLMCATDNALAQPDMFLMIVMAAFASIREGPDAAAAISHTRQRLWRQFGPVGNAPAMGMTNLNRPATQPAIGSPPRA